MGRRLFLAVPLPENIATEVSELCAGLQSDCAPARWIEKDNLHVTVLFLGEVEDADYEVLWPKLAEAWAGSHQLDLSITGLAAGPPRRSPTMLWLKFKPSVGFAAVVMVARQVAESVIELGTVHGEPLPHVTLARFRGGVSAPCQNRVESIEYKQTFTADRVTLFESELSADGPTYYELQTFQLGI